jgi:hypothetical protein
MGDCQQDAQTEVDRLVLIDSTSLSNLFYYTFKLLHLSRPSKAYTVMTHFLLFKCLLFYEAVMKYISLVVSTLTASRYSFEDSRHLGLIIRRR